MNKEEMFKLVEEAKAGSQKAFTALYNNLYPQTLSHIYSLINDKELAEDLTSDTYVKAFTKIHKFKYDVSFVMWVKTIAVNTVIDHMRRKHMNVVDRSIDDEDNSLQFVDEYDSSPEEKYIEKEQRMEFENNIDNLNGRSRQVISMRYIDGLSYKEIAEKAGVSIGTVKSYISKSTKKIKPKN